MWRLDRKVYAALAFIALVGLIGTASVDAQGRRSSERRDHRPSVGERQTARREMAARQSHRTHPGRAEAFHARARPEAFRAREYPVATYHQKIVDRSVKERRPADSSVIREPHFAGGGRVREDPRGLANGRVHVVRYGHTLSGTVERTIRPGLMTRTFVGGGHLLYTHVYQRHVWYQFGRAFAYETFVPAVRFPTVYYAWALAAWPRPVSYTWGWQMQPWYPTYGSLFTPYPVYTSPDLWMTDYIIAQSMQTAYQTQAVRPASEPSPPVDPSAAAPDSSPAPDSSADAAAAQPGNSTPASHPSDAPLAPQSSDTRSAPEAPPPAITPQVKAQLDAQIKVQLQELQAAAAMPEVLTSRSTPPALRPNHVFFQVVEPLNIPLGPASLYCSLSPNDYIKRIGGMSDDDWMIPVVVELSGSSDCPEGLHTRIGLNDLNAMENEQEAQVMEAMQAASKGMGPNGPPSGPGVHPTLVATGYAVPDPSALDAIRRAQ